MKGIRVLPLHIINYNVCGIPPKAGKSRRPDQTISNLGEIAVYPTRFLIDFWLIFGRITAKWQEK
jgi:hypothetical protein